MAETYTETNKISYGQNLKNAFSGVIVGLIIFVLSFVVLWKNEGRNVAELAKATYMDKAAIEISADQIDRENDNKLVQLSGKATTDATLTDGMVTLPNVFALSRKVEMYQWEEKVKTETKDKLGGGTTETKTYTYEKVWSEDEIDSKDFKQPHANPTFPIKSERFYAESGKLGEFNLTEKQSKAMSEYSEYRDLPQNPQYKIYGNTYYKGYNPESPNIGDIRISYTYVPSGVEISVIGSQKSDNTLVNYPFKNSSIYLQQSGIKTKGEMIETFRNNNNIFTNIVRLVGWLMMFMGLNLLIGPFVTLFKVVPFLEKIVGFFSRGVIFLVSVALSLLTISIAWFAYRPFLTVGVLVAAGCAIFLFKTKFKNKKETV